MLFHKGGLNNNSVEFHPNQDNFRCSKLLPFCRCCRCCPRDDDGADLPEAIVESAKTLVISQRKAQFEDQARIYLKITHPSRTGIDGGNSLEVGCKLELFSVFISFTILRLN